MRPVFFATTIAIQTVAIATQQCFNKVVSREREPASSMKTNHFYAPHIALIVLLGCTVAGCASKPQAEPANMPVKTSQKTFGSFNLQKRHGLGGWEGPSGPSEQQLLQQMLNQSASSRPETLANPQPGKESP